MATELFQKAYKNSRSRSGFLPVLVHNATAGSDVFNASNDRNAFSPSMSASRAGGFNRSEVDAEEMDGLGVPRMPHQVDRCKRMIPKSMAAFPFADELGGPVGRFVWVESRWFQILSALVICGNAIVIGLETDMRDLKIWFWIEQALLIFFVFELSVRLCRHGCMYFKHEEDMIWNLLDFSIVMSGVVDTWVMPVIELIKQTEKKGRHVGVIFMLMRMLRLLRIVRLFRLVKIVRPLFNLAQGVLAGAQGMFWVLVFMIMTLYACAILCTRFIGHGGALPEEVIDEDDIQPIRKMFANVPESMFTLFGTMTSWSLLKFAPLFDPFPLLRPIFVVIYIYSAWALLAVMTGVVSENLIAIREQMVAENQAKEEKRKQNITSTLLHLFEKADEDKSGSVSRAEFNEMLKDPMLMKLLIKNSNLRIQDLHDLFDWLDHDGGGTITIDEFMTGFKWVNDPLTAKTIVKLQERLVADVASMRDDTTDEIHKRFTQVMTICSHPIKKVHAISEQMDNLDDMCDSLRLGLKEDQDQLPTRQKLCTIELNLHSKMDEAFDRINRVYSAVEGSKSK